MKQTTIPIRMDARVIIKCNADLSVEGNENSTLIVIVDQSDCLRMKEENGVFRIVADADCRVVLPESVTVTIEKVSGNCNLENLRGRVVIGKIGGNLNLNRVNGASVESVGGDCRILEASGAIELARVGDLLMAENLQTILAGSVGGDVRLANVQGKVDVSAGDEVQIQFLQNNLPEIRVKAGSDIRLYVSKDANGQLELNSGGEEIKVHAGGQEVEMEQRGFSLPLGEGGARIELIAGDSILVTDEEKPDWNDESGDWGTEYWKDFGFDIANKVKESMRSASESMNQAWRVAEKASRDAGKQVEHAFRELDERGFGFGRSGKVVGFSMDGDKTSTSSSKTGPSDEERMLVLKMLQDKKISVEEAEKLLNALDR